MNLKSIIETGIARINGILYVVKQQDWDDGDSLAPSTGDGEQNADRTGSGNSNEGKSIMDACYVCPAGYPLSISSDAA